MDSWKAPEVEVTIGELTQAGTCEQMIVEAFRSQPVATAKLVLSNVRFEWENGAKDLDTLLIKWGWDGEDLAPLFDGTVKRAYLDEKLHVFGQCRGRQIVDTLISRTYKKEAASAIVKHLIEPCDFTKSTVYDEQTIIERLPLADHSIYQAIMALDLDYAVFCDPTGAFFWGPPDEEQDAVATFAHGDDVFGFSLLRAGRYLLDVFAAPIWHSQVIELVKGEVTTRYFVEGVRHTLGQNEDDGARSRLWLRELLA